MLKVIGFRLKYMALQASDKLYTEGEMTGAAKVLVVLDNPSSGLHVPKHPRGVNALWHTFLNKQKGDATYTKQMHKYKNLLRNGDADLLERVRKTLPWMGE
jgi:hypothetical protein